MPLSHVVTAVVVTAVVVTTVVVTAVVVAAVVVTAVVATVIVCGAGRVPTYDTSTPMPPSICCWRRSILCLGNNNQKRHVRKSPSNISFGCDCPDSHESDP